MDTANIDLTKSQAVKSNFIWFAPGQNISLTDLLT